MTIQIGDRLPDATLLKLTGKDPEVFSTQDLFGSGRHIIFGMPGAFTATCSALHLPNVVAHAARLREAADSVSILTVNDPFVMRAWGEVNGTQAAGIEMVADPASELSTAMGLTFTVPQRGFHARSTRYSMLVEDGRVAQLNPEGPNPSCDISGGEVILSQLGLG